MEAKFSYLVFAYCFSSLCWLFVLGRIYHHSTPNPLTIGAGDACGVCHSDLHVKKGERPFSSPCVVGHQITNEVVEHSVLTDSKIVERFPIGTQVVGAFIMPCGSCFFFSKDNIALLVVLEAKFNNQGVDNPEKRQLVCVTKTLEQEAHLALDKLTTKISMLNLQRVRQIKSHLIAIPGRVQKVRDELEHLLDGDKDMAQMYLTEKLQQQQFENSSLFYPRARWFG